MAAPDLNTVPPFYHNYIRQIDAGNAHDATAHHLKSLIAALADMSEQDWNYAYANGKWTLKELVQHIIDAERIFCYRALSIARGDANPLPGFDENAYAAASSANHRSGGSLLQELRAVGASTSCLFSSFNEAQLAASGLANGNPISVNAIAYIIAGHAAHHTRIILERYLDKAYTPVTF